MRTRPNLNKSTREQVAAKSQKNESGKYLDQKTGQAIENKHYLHRSYIRKSTREQVLARAERNEKGQLLDANTRKPIEGKYDIGHKTDHEFRKARDEAEAKHMTQAEFNDQQNNPDHLQIEDPHSNRSHQFEAKDTPQQTPQSDALSTEQSAAQESAGQTNAPQSGTGQSDASSQSQSSGNSSTQASSGTSGAGESGEGQGMSM